jgi:hypothetical protein
MENLVDGLLELTVCASVHCELCDCVLKIGHIIHVVIVFFVLL